MMSIGELSLFLIKAFCGLNGLILLVLFALQRKLVWPVPSIAVDPRTYGAQLIVIDKVLGRKGGEKIALAHYPASDRSAPVLVFFHGNGDQIGAGASFVGRKFSRAYGYGFLAVEYPTYPLSEGGKISETSAYEAAEAALRYLTEDSGLSVARERVIMMGQSIGTGVALEMAARGWGKKVVLISPFLSLPKLVSSILPNVIAWLRFFLLDKFMNSAKISGLDQPICIIHGVRDEIVPYQHGEELAKIGGEKVQFYSIENAGHNDIFRSDLSLEVLRTVARFIG